LAKYKRQNVQSCNLHNYFANFEENAAYIANIFCMQKYGEIDFQKQAAYVSLLMNLTPDDSFGHRYLNLYLV